MNKYEQAVLLIAQTTYLCANKPLISTDMYTTFAAGIYQITNEVSEEFDRPVHQVEQDVVDFMDHMPTEDLDMAIKLRAENRLH